MGSWGKRPWDNDYAADWFLSLFEKTQLRKSVVAALRFDIEEHAEIVRAAAHMVYLLGHTYVWPIETIDEDLQLAIDKLDQLREHPDMPEDELTLERNELASRLERAQRNSTVS